MRIDVDGDRWWRDWMHWFDIEWWISIREQQSMIDQMSMNAEKVYIEHIEQSRRPTCPFRCKHPMESRDDTRPHSQRVVVNSTYLSIDTSLNESPQWRSMRSSIRDWYRWAHCMREHIEWRTIEILSVAICCSTFAFVSRFTLLKTIAFHT